MEIGQLKPRHRAVPRVVYSKLGVEAFCGCVLETLSGELPVLPATGTREDPILSRRFDSNGAPAVGLPADGDRYLCGIRSNVLDLNLRFRVHALEQKLRE